MNKNKIISNSATINWQCNGDFNFTTGYGATKAESGIANFAAFVAPLILYIVVWRELNWSALQLIVASFLTLDMIGGVLTNSLSSMKRFLHTTQKIEVNWLGKLVGSKLWFPAVHLQLFAIPLCFDITWSYAFIWYGLMMIAVVVIQTIPLYLQRPTAMLIVILSIILAHLAPAPIGLEWLAPIFIIKLVLSHGVREEPYRPKLDD